MSYTILSRLYESSLQQMCCMWEIDNHIPIRHDSSTTDDSMCKSSKGEGLAPNKRALFCLPNYY